MPAHLCRNPWHPGKVRDIPPELVAMMEMALDEYWEELQDTELANSSIEDYFYFAYCFVRWTRGEFQPGAHVKA